MNIHKKINQLKEYGLSYAHIQASEKPVYYIEKYNRVMVTPHDNISPMYDADSSYDIMAVETFDLARLTEGDIDLIVKALHFYSRSRNPEVEHLRREYEIMRIMHGEPPPS